MEIYKRIYAALLVKEKCRGFTFFQYQYCNEHKHSLNFNESHCPDGSRSDMLNALKSMEVLPHLCSELRLA